MFLDPFPVQWLVMGVATSSLGNNEWGSNSGVDLAGQLDRLF